MTNLVIAVVSLGIALVVTPVVIIAARRTGVMDRPGALKPQSHPVPYLGGVAVFAGAAVGALAGRPTLLVPLGMALVLGVADDRFELSPWVRLAGQFFVGAAVVVTCPVHLPGVAAATTIIVVSVLLINGVNLLDGLDLLAGGVVAVAALAFALLLGGWGRHLGVALAAALVGFLAYNRPPARVYLGDGGSYLLGTALAVLLAATWAPGVPASRAAAALALVAIPAAEVAFAVVRRWRGHRSLVTGDRGHPYDRLVASGWPRPAASLAYVAMEGILATAAVIAGLRASVAAAMVVDVAGAALLVASAAVTGALAPDEDART